MSEARTPGTCTIRSGWAQGHPFPQTTEVEERYAEFDRWLDRERAAARREGQAEALRQAAYEFAEGAWQDQWSADAVECDVTAVQSTYRWFVAKADQIENGVNDE